MSMTSEFGLPYTFISLLHIEVGTNKGCMNRSIMISSLNLLLRTARYTTGTKCVIKVLRTTLTFFDTDTSSDNTILHLY